jgi:hypothetical protein
MNKPNIDHNQHTMNHLKKLLSHKTEHKHSLSKTNKENKATYKNLTMLDHKKLINL